MQKGDHTIPAAPPGPQVERLVFGQQHAGVFGAGLFPGSLQQLVTLADSVEAPVAAGSQLGTLTITSGEEVVAELPILAGEEIPRVTFGQMLVQMLRTAFLCG